MSVAVDVPAVSDTVTAPKFRSERGPWLSGTDCTGDQLRNRGGVFVKLVVHGCPSANATDGPFIGPVARRSLVDEVVFDAWNGHARPVDVALAAPARRSVRTFGVPDVGKVSQEVRSALAAQG